MIHIQKAITLLSVALTLVACGGGGGTSAPQTATKTATVSFNIISTARLTAPVQGVQLSAYLPPGVTVSTNAGSTTMSSTALVAGNGITSPNLLVFGTYSAAVHKVKITVTTDEDTFRGGEFAKLTVSYPETTTLTVTDFTSLNSPSFPFLEAGGYVVGPGSVDLTNKLRASLGVVFN